MFIYAHMSNIVDNMLLNLRSLLQSLCCFINRQSTIGGRAALSHLVVLSVEPLPQPEDYPPITPIITTITYKAMQHLIFLYAGDDLLSPLCPL